MTLPGTIPENLLTALFTKPPAPYSAIYKAAGLMVPGLSMILTGTIPMEQKSVHWLSMGAASRNHLCE